AQNWIVTASSGTPATYVVTPNAAHLVAAAENPAIRRLYESADLCLNDSRIVSGLAWIMKRVRIPVAPGSDLTQRLLDDARTVDIPIFVVGLREDALERLVHLYPRHSFRHHFPPMGFISDSQSIEACLNFLAEHSGKKIVVLAVGAPQQEILAARWSALAESSGVAICTGAALDFIVGAQKRAPLFMRRAGLEWLFRLLANPKRLWRRYLIESPRLILHMARERVRPVAVK
ncbi:MAG: glycosyltransferase, partial [Alphaproteobacteria bacterium]